MALKFSKPVFIGCIAVLVLVACTAVTLVVKQNNKETNNKKEAAKQQINVSESVQGIADSYKPDKTYATLPEAEQDAFLEQKAAHFGLPPGQEVTPETLTNACLERRERELSGMIASNPDAIEANRSTYNEAAKKTREYCYQQYAKDGTIPHEDMPHSMAH